MGLLSATPSFSVLIANHNHANLVVRAVESALAQQYPEALREVIVVDDGSTDDSRERLAAFAGRTDVTVVAQENRGQTAAFAAALARARGEVVCLLDSDDTCAPDKLATLAAHLATLRASGDALFLCHDLHIVDGRSGQAIGETWFDVVDLRRAGPSLHVSAATRAFPFAVTSGMVFGRALLQEILAQVPAWEWPMGTDDIVGPAAMLIAGEVHYLHRPLGGYVVHGGNHSAQIVDGHFRRRPLWQAVVPRKLRLLELLLDGLALTEAERAQRAGYLGRLEHQARAAPLGRRHAQPLLSVVVDIAGPTEVDGATRLAEDTAQALAAQTEPHHETVWVCTAATRACVPAAATTVVEVPVGTGTYGRLRAGFGAARGGYLAFLEPGDLPERRFVERHLQAHRYGTLPMLTVSDLRLLDAAGHVLHTGIQGTAAGWGHGAPLHVAAFAAPLRDWPLAPLPAVVLRRTPMLQAFFAVESLPVPERRVGWLLCHHLLQMGGATRLPENLVDLRLPAHVTANASWLSQFIDRHGPLPPPDLAASAAALFAAWARASALERASFAPAWEARFVRWLLESGGGDTAGRIERELQAHPDAAWAERIRGQLRAPTR